MKLRFAAHTIICKQLNFVLCESALKISNGRKIACLWSEASYLIASGVENKRCALRN